MPALDICRNGGQREGIVHAVVVLRTPSPPLLLTGILKPFESNFERHFVIQLPQAQYRRLHKGCPRHLRSGQLPPLAHQCLPTHVEQVPTRCVKARAHLATPSASPWGASISQVPCTERARDCVREAWILADRVRATLLAYSIEISPGRCVLLDLRLRKCASSICAVVSRAEMPRRAPTDVPSY